VGAPPADAPTEPAIEATGVSKAFGATHAVDDADVTVAAGELVALLGPSGSGKTTLLRTIAGLEVPDRGMVRIAGRTVCGPHDWVEPEERRVGMVFQDGALFPHLDVAANVAFGVPERADRADRVAACLELVGLGDRGRSYPHELSGGERQRVALARALAPEPDVILLDEPFAALDATLRSALRDDVADILARAGTSALLVTHDQQEALSMADVVVVMRDGAVVQTGTPEELYRAPATAWVAEFLGAAEVLPGTAADGTVTCELGRFAADPALDGPVDVVVRPEVLGIGPVGAAGATGTVRGRSYFGHDQLVRIELPSGRVVHSRRDGGARWRTGDEVTLVVEGQVTVLARPTG
jgi:iron(III) transport system ATP-binding protein